MSKHLGCKRPGPKSIRIITRDKKVISQCLTRASDFVFAKGKGSFVWDADGRKFLDFSAMVAVMNIGHSNPVIRQALEKQLVKGMHAGFPDFVSEVPVRFTEKLVSMLPPGLDKAFLSNSGTEAVEAAYKNARWHSNKKWTIAFDNAFHGRTLSSLSLTKSKPVQKERFAPFMPVKHSPFAYCYRCPWNKSHPGCGLPCLEALEKTMNSCQGDLSAVFMEPVQGEGGYIIPPKEFVKGVRKLCDQYDALLVVDEIQAGCYRTGKFLSIDNFGVKPDTVCLAKAIGGGLPLGATVFNKKNSRWPHGAHANTFGGNLGACTSGLAALDFMKKKRLGNKAVKTGKEIFKRLKEIEEKSRLIGDVRGKGLMIGVELVKNKKTKAHAINERLAFVHKAYQEGLLLLPCGTSSVRIAPPLTISIEDALKGMDIFESSLKKIEGN